MDKPIRGLPKDLKPRGLLDSTLVVWHTEFRRLPISQSLQGRDHNHFASPRGEKCALVAAIRGVVYGGKRATGEPRFGVTFRDIA